MAQKPPLLRCNRPSLQSVSSCKMYLSILQNIFVQLAKYIFQKEKALQQGGRRRVQRNDLKIELSARAATMAK